MLSAPVHNFEFRFRRALNWFPLGLAYAFLYMGRYNLTVAKNALGDLLSKADFGEISSVGTIVYGVAFIINGPLTDRVGGRKTMLVAVLGALLANAIMGTSLLAASKGVLDVPVYWILMVLYAVNMYFQSFAAVAIVTVKAPWFHVRERGTFSTIFGIMIASGIYFAFDWGAAIVAATRANLPEQLPWFGQLFHAIFGVGGQGVDANWWVFFTPAIVLGVLWWVLFFFLKNTPGEAGFQNFDTGEAAIRSDGEQLPFWEVFRRILTHPVLVIVCAIEFCTGVVRNGTMQWYPIFAKEIGINTTFFVPQNWGLVLLIAGVAGSLLTGYASDAIFQSRRGPMAAVLYGVMISGTFVMALFIGGNVWIAGTAIIMISMSVIGVHGILSGTSTADFGGAKSAGTAVGIVDGLVYLGTGLQFLAIGYLAPTGEAAKEATNWVSWPVFMVPFAVFGFLLSLRIWNAVPKKASAKEDAAAEPLEKVAPVNVYAKSTPETPGATKG